MGVEYKKSFQEQRDLMLDKLNHLRDDPLFKKLYIPTAEEYIKFDIVNSANPYVLAVKEKNEVLNYHNDLKQQYRNDRISNLLSENEYKLRMCNLFLQKLKYEYKFGTADTFPFDCEIKNKIFFCKCIINEIEKELQDMQEKNDATATV